MSTAAFANDEAAYRRLVEPHRRELHAHCYRMLGSVQDAEDALQDALLRAWRGLDRFEGRSSPRSWLYRIATNTCLDAIARRPSKRELPIDREPDDAPLTETVWLEPYPDDPDARYEQRESIELAFIAALQHLPANQRAVLILREVLGFSAKETAEMLDTTPASVNSAMQRARASVDERLPEQSQQATLRTLGDDEIRDLVERYVDAWDRGDIGAVVSMLAEEATFSMPPNFEWFRGRDAIREFLPTGPLSIPRRFIPTQANGQLAFGTYKLIDGEWLRNAIHVITVDSNKAIVDAVAFLDASLFPRFGLPLTPPDPEPYDMAISPPAPRAGAPLSRRLSETHSSPVRELLQIAMRPEVISLAGGLPAPDTFDVEGLGAAFAEVMSGPDAIRALQYSTTEGDPALRARLAAFMSTRGLAVAADDLLITTGSQQALGLVAAALLNPGDVVLVEDPTYLAALQAFQLADLRPVAIPCDDDGPLPDALVEVARTHAAKVAYLIPTFQNPTGRTMPARRRARIAEAAATAGLWLVEDDPYSALRLEGEPVDLLAAEPAARDRTIVIQTLSKVLSPGLRIGYVRAPAALRGPLAVAKQAADLHTSTVTQLAAERWLAAHDLSTHIAGLAAHYRPRRDALLAGLEEHLPAGSRCTHPEGGLFIWVTLPEGHDAEAILARAIDRGLAFVPGRYFYAGEPPRNTLRVSFATATPAELTEAAARLGAAIAG